MSNHDLNAMLNQLIDTCRDGQEGYRTAAENINNSEFRRLFNIFSQQRAQFITELEAEVHRLGGQLAEAGSVTRAAHPAGDNRSAGAGSGEASIIADCQCGEELAVNKYQEILKKDLPLDVQYVVKRQYMDIRDAYDRMRILQRAA